jgi:hypothetical protein
MALYDILRDVYALGIEILRYEKKYESNKARTTRRFWAV